MERVEGVGGGGAWEAGSIHKHMQHSIGLAQIQFVSSEPQEAVSSNYHLPQHMKNMAVEQKKPWHIVAKTPLSM